MQLIDAHTHELAMTILATAKELTLATVRGDGSPHASAVNFAAEGLILYAAISIDGSKAHDLKGEARVALTVSAPYDNRSDIQGMSMQGRATFVDPQELSFASALLLNKLLAYARSIAQPQVRP